MYYDARAVINYYICITVNQVNLYHMLQLLLITVYELDRKRVLCRH